MLCLYVSCPAFLSGQHLVSDSMLRILDVQRFVCVRVNVSASERHMISCVYVSIVVSLLAAKPI
jgi:hypothetical protein